jgi:hypothetical protein
MVSLHVSVCGLNADGDTPIDVGAMPCIAQSEHNTVLIGLGGGGNTGDAWHRPYNPISWTTGGEADPGWIW